MRFKQYTNKTSLGKRNSRLVKGGKTEISGAKLGWWERKTTNLAADELNEMQYTITMEIQHRPDLIAYLLYGSAELEWVVLQYNNIVDVIEELSAGRTIKLPSRQYVNSYIYSRI